MALDNTLNVEITASVDGLKKGLIQADRGLKKFGTSTDKANKPLGKFNNTLVKGSVPAMTSFSQVVQDAPFGIRGVANNITQLTAQFGHLSKNAGGTKNALKAMLSTLAGPAGILLAVSVVTSLLVTYGDTLFKSSTAAEKAAKKNEDLAKSLEDYRQTLIGVDKAQLKGAQSAAKELTTLTLLKAQIDNVNLGDKKRIEAIDELRKKYPAYLQGLTDEGILAGDLAGIYDTLSTAILKKARAQAAASLITENTKKQLTLESQLAKAVLENGNRQVALDKAKANIINGNLVDRKVGEELILRLGGLQADKLKEQVEITQQIVGLQAESLKLAQEVSEQGGIVPINVKVIADGGGGITKFTDNIKSTLKGFVPIITDESRKINAAILNAVPTQKALSDRFYDLQLAALKFNSQFGSIVQSGITEALTGLGSAIGDALTGGANILEGAGAAVLGAIGSMMVQLGKMAIGIGVGIKAIKTALTTLNPAVAIGAGLALVALGTVFKKGAASIANAGGSSSGGRGGAGVSDFSGGETGFSVSGGDQRNKVVWEIEGTKLVGVVQNTLTRNRALGGNLNLSGS